MRRKGSEIAVCGPERDRNIVRRNGFAQIRYGSSETPRSGLRLLQAPASRCNRRVSRPASRSAPRAPEASPASPRVPERRRRVSEKDIRMTADRARRGARRIEKHGVECFVGRECQCVGRRGFGGEPQPLQIALQPPSRPADLSTAVTWAPPAASCAAFPPGAAQRSRAPSRPATSPNSFTGKAAAAS